MCVELAAAALYLSWACAWTSLTIFNRFYSYTPLPTIVRVANSATTSITLCQLADAVMTAGAILLPDIALMLILVMAVLVACTVTLLDNFYSPAHASGRTKRQRRSVSPIPRWIVRTMADCAAKMLSRVEAAIGSLRTQRCHQVRHCRSS
jgi:ATP/ADP translocase